MTSKFLLCFSLHPKAFCCSFWVRERKDCHCCGSQRDEAAASLFTCLPQPSIQWCWLFPPIVEGEQTSTDWGWGQHPKRVIRLSMSPRKVSTTHSFPSLVNHVAKILGNTEIRTFIKQETVFVPTDISYKPLNKVWSQNTINHLAAHGVVHAKLLGCIGVEECCLACDTDMVTWQNRAVPCVTRPGCLCLLWGASLLLNSLLT